MLISDIPGKIDKAFASGAGASFIRSIPDPSQIGVINGAASYTDGFPPLTAKQVAAGGFPPDIRDVNGILLAITSWVRWMIAGGPLFYDSAFATAIGGYPNKAVIQSTTPGYFWLSLVDNNMGNPDTGATNWQKLGPPGTFFASIGAGSGTFTVINASMRLRLWGAGGGGGYGGPGAGNGGSGGAYGETILQGLAPGATIAYNVAAASPGGTSANPVGTYGATSNFGAYLYCTGGLGGYQGVAGGVPNASAGTAASASFGAGADGFHYSPEAGHLGDARSVSGRTGAGGGSFSTSGGAEQMYDSAFNGNDGQSPGGGGAGGSLGKNGGAGGSGILILASA